MSDVITIGSEILIALRSTKDVKVMFVKKSDGTKRVMNCTLDFNKIPKEHHPKKSGGLCSCNTHE